MDDNNTTIDLTKDKLKELYPDIEICFDKEIDYSERNYDEDVIYEFDFDLKKLSSRIRQKLEEQNKK